MEGKRKFLDWRFVWTERRRQNRLAFILFWSILMYFFFRSFVVSVGVIGDISMHPTLGQGDYYLVNKYIYHFVRPERGDIVVFRTVTYGTHEEVKRVVGLPGETLLIRDTEVFIDGQLLPEPYRVGGTYPNFGPYTIERDHYFVMGDTRWVREDSRDYGAVSEQSIVGKIKPGVLFPLR